MEHRIADKYGEGKEDNAIHGDAGIPIEMDFFAHQAVHLPGARRYPLIEKQSNLSVIDLADQRLI